MKLIDVDDLTKKLGISEHCNDCKYDNCPHCNWRPNPVDTCEAIFDAAKVEAIPTQWIINNYIKNRPADESVYYMAMITKWREENADVN